MGRQAVSLRSCTAIVLEEPMTKDQAIEVLITHAKRCPEPEPRERGYPEDIRDDYNEWRERQAKVSEAVRVLTSRPSETGASFARHLDHASALVRSWPGWKQHVLGSTTTAPEDTHAK